MAIKVLSRAYAVLPLPSRTPTQPVGEAAKPPLGCQRKLQILDCESESQSKTGATAPRVRKASSLVPALDMPMVDTQQTSPGLGSLGREVCVSTRSSVNEQE